MRSPSSSEASFDDEGGAGEILAEINITPLTDVFIVLLIIFMVVASSEVGRQASPEEAQTTEDFSGKLAERAFEIQTPEGSGSAEIVKKDVVVSVHPDGALFVDNVETTLAGLGPILAQLRQDPAVTSNLVVRGDKTAPYDTIIRVISTAEKHGFHDVGLATRAE